MKIDIGSNEGILSDADVGLDIVTNPNSWEDWEGRVDILADAHSLPIRDKAFSYVYSSRCVGSYAGLESVKEALRILSDEGTLELHVFLPGVPMVIGYLLGKITIMSVESDEEPVYLVYIKAQRLKPEDIMVDWGPELPFVSGKEWLKQEKEYLQDVRDNGN